ncbi:preprotein translocase subunit SecY [Candidatus Woesearchaeota archaeon]|jgi:preprotein translocase subunit SecY|nr:preprotein translocase subunit SecY [Candidatus Woesearchaeota archaeon]MBT5271907.1 preprotein translocase subunit SecY [Candidatus Woesearchaeota archaeon]MBT6040686.1 preprotein translocase subunit SecY [Candidatus Woesearchaeota archaeon]MBT6336195.1 preprotein translocase subunit SecY [Candidatus Woesearchaeota archaeon]MBT7928038.1 preprotein translocase subunit SecY [Candidatus Woesearchaeota archaeon]
MAWYQSIIYNLPEVAGPTQKRLAFKEKLKWTGIILVLFFILGIIPLFGLGANALSRFEFLSVILGASFGSIISLGIGPIVTASIVLQLLNGSGIVKFDLTTPNGKRNFQGINKLLAIFFIVFEAGIYVFMGGLAPPGEVAGTSLFFTLQLLLVFQLTLGGILILLMDEIVSKWGFGSGISLFIAAGVSKTIFVQTFSWVSSAEVATDVTYSTGVIPQLFQALGAGDPGTAFLAISTIVATVLVFVIAVYVQAMKIEIPLSFGRIRGHGIRWPLSFTYANVIPVILVSALLANMQLWAKLLQNWGMPILGKINEQGTAVSGLVSWLYSPAGSKGLVGMIITNGGFDIGFRPYGQSLIYLLIMILGCMLFSYFWVQTSGMDARSQAKQMIGSGLTIPGFRKDERILERLLTRYIGPLTLMGGATIGFLAGLADILGAIGTGTGIMLTVMIIYRLYEEIAKQHMMDMHPMLRQMMGG